MENHSVIMAVARGNSHITEKQWMMLLLLLLLLIIVIIIVIA